MSTTDLRTIHTDILRDVHETALILAAAQLERDDAILRARQAGVPVRTIADHAGVSPQTVLNLVQRRARQDGAQPKT